MKKFFRIAGIALAALILLLILLPVVFRSKIAEAVQTSLDENLNARVLFEPDNLSLSLISSFPDFRLSIRNFGIVNKAPFEGDTLFYAGNFGAGISLMSVISGDKIRIRKILLEDARIRVFVLEDGSNNYSIMKAGPDKAAEPTEKEAGAFSLKIDSWEVKNLSLQYLDAGSGTMAAIEGMDHEGSGDFSQDLVDLKSSTSIASLSMMLDSVSYLNNRRFASDMDLQFNQKENSIRFGDNFLELNAFRFAFQGDAAFGGEKPKFNLTFSSPESSIKGLISLIPAVFSKDFDKVNADGTLAFEGHVKGSYDSLNLPDFGLKLKVDKGMIQYPGLPQKIENLHLDLNLNHAQGPADLLIADLKDFSLKLGQNPLKASGRVEGLNRPKVNMKMQGRLNLEELSKAFPVEGLSMRGLLDLNVKADGRYDAASKEFPQLAANILLKKGYVKSKEFPEALEALELDMSAHNSNGKISGSSAEIRQFSFTMAGEPFSMNASLENPDDLKYRLAAKGTVDFEKMTHLFPLEGMKLSGKMKADVQASGLMSDVKASRYEKLPTSGSAELSNFVYKADDLNQPVNIARASLEFSPKEMNLSGMEMKVGKSDFLLSGSIRNHLAYVLRNETLQASLKMKSVLTDANQLMALSGEAPPSSAAGAAPQAKAESLPANLDLDFYSENGKILYDNMVLENASGSFTLKKGILGMKNLRFRTLEGNFQMSGEYDPREASRPAFSYQLNMDNVSIPKAYETFSTIRALVPVARNMEGEMACELSMNGKLDPGMSPLLPSLNGKGSMKVSGGKVKDFSVMKGINSLAKTSLPTEVLLQDVNVRFAIRDGRVDFEPFDVKAGGQLVNIGGSNGLDGTVDYRIKTSVPAGAAGTAVASALSSLSGKSISSPKDVKFEIAGTGPAASPKFRLVKVDAGSVKQEAKAAVMDKAKELKAEAEAKVRAEAERLKKEAEAKAKSEADRLKKEAEDKAKGELEKLKKKFKF